MFVITVDSEAVERKIDSMTQNIETLHEAVPKAFLDWQAEDMHRKRPYAQVQQADNKDTTVVVATTRIWPRGRSVLKGQDAKLDRKRGRRNRVHHRHREHISTRPILRRELYDKLVERLRALLQTIMR